MESYGKSLKAPIITVIFIFLCLFVFFKLFGPIPFFIQNVTTTKESLFSVQGTGEVSVIPDTVLISFGVTKNSSRVEDAKNEVNTVINKITEGIKDLGVDVKDIKTVNYSVNPQYDYARGTQKITGYQVDTNLSVKIQPVDKANQAIDVASQNGANQIGSLQFTVDDDKQKELEKEARKKAIEDAKEKAQSLADAAGIKLGRIVDIKESGQRYIPPYPMMRMSAEKADISAPTELNPGENKITSQVTLYFQTF